MKNTRAPCRATDYKNVKNYSVCGTSYKFRHSDDPVIGDLQEVRNTLKK